MRMALAEALKRGKASLSEKPIATSVEAFAMSGRLRANIEVCMAGYTGGSLHR